MEIKDLRKWLGEREASREIQRSFATRLQSTKGPALASERKEERSEREPLSMDASGKHSEAAREPGGSPT